jgi:F-type H+-transporting ATPase subunit gamma
MATLRDIQRKIGAVKKTRQITRAMNMVAAAKLRGTQARMENFEPYAVKFAQVLENLASRMDPEIHPLLMRKDMVAKVELLHFTADRGLCGSFNVNAIAMAEKWIESQQKEGVDCSLTVVGKKGRDFFRKRNYPITTTHINIYDTVDIAFVNQMTNDFIGRFLRDEVDEVYMIYSRFLSMAKQEPAVVKLIPIEPPKGEEKEEGMSPVPRRFS